MHELIAIRGVPQVTVPNCVTALDDHNRALIEHNLRIKYDSILNHSLTLITLEKRDF